MHSEVLHHQPLILRKQVQAEETPNIDDSQAVSRLEKENIGKKTQLHQVIDQTEIAQSDIDRNQEVAENAEDIPQV